MIDPYFVFLGAFLGLSGSTRYVVRTLQGRASPNRVSFFLWGAASWIAFFAQLAAGVGLPAVLTFAAAFSPTMIFAASYFGKAAPWRITRFDLGCGAVSVAALVVWLGMDNPTLAVVFAVFADFIGGVPTIVKAWRAPWTEEPVFFGLVGTNGVITLLTIQEWTVATWAFPAYIASVGLALFLIVMIRGRLLSARTRHDAPTGHP